MYSAPGHGNRYDADPVDVANSQTLDSFDCFRFGPNNHWFAMVVADGHGHSGRLVSTHVVRTARGFLTAAPLPVAFYGTRTPSVRHCALQFANRSHRAATAEFPPTAFH